VLVFALRRIIPLRITLQSTLRSGADERFDLILSKTCRSTQFYRQSLPDLFNRQDRKLPGIVSFR
jgi:hypothetical protein